MDLEELADGFRRQGDLVAPAHLRKFVQDQQTRRTYSWIFGQARKLFHNTVANQLHFVWEKALSL